MTRRTPISAPFSWAWNWRSSSILLVFLVFFLYSCVINVVFNLVCSVLSLLECPGAIELIYLNLRISKSKCLGLHNIALTVDGGSANSLREYSAFVHKRVVQPNRLNFAREDGGKQLPLIYTFFRSCNQNLLILWVTTLTHNSYSLEPLNFSQIPCRITDQLSNTEAICEGNDEYTWANNCLGQAHLQGWGIIMVPSYH